MAPAFTQPDRIATDALPDATREEPKHSFRPGYLYTAPGNRHGVRSYGGCAALFNVPQEVQRLKPQLARGNGKQTATPPVSKVMQRQSFKHRGLTLSYLDSGGDAQALIALHAHWMEGLTFAPLAMALAPQWRVIAPDQRGHGESDHAPSYTRDDYLGDIAALFAHLDLREAVLLGNSLGGVNAYQFAARRPSRVRALIIEDIGVEVPADMPYVLNWSGVFATRESLSERIGPRMLPYLQDSFRLTPDGWRLAFEPREMMTSQANLAGDHWKDWLTAKCPALLIRGRNSIVTNPEHLEQMAARRGNTVFRTLDGGHVAHFDNPDGFAKEVQSFLQPLAL